MIFRSLLLVMTTIGLGFVVSEPVRETDAKSDRARVEAFLERLVGEWRMKGRGRPAKQAPWYRTASSMSATLRLKDRALVREIDAPAIDMEALDVITFDEESGRCTYIYIASNRPAPIVMVGEMTGDDEMTVYLEDQNYRTVISLVGEDEMVARDYRVDESGEEWMSRDVNHYREP